MVPLFAPPGLYPLVRAPMIQVRRLLSNLKPVQLEISLDSKVFALKSRVFALLGAKALDFGAKALEFFDVPAKDLVKFQVG